MQMTEEQYLAHYGILRRSGRYPWGSGDNSGTQMGRNQKFLDVVNKHRKEGMSEKEVAELYGLRTKQLRDLKSIARNELKQDRIRQAQRMVDKGMSNGAIAERMGLPGESSVRALLAEGASDRADSLKATTDMLRREVEEKGAIDVGTDVYRSISLSDNPGARIGVSSTRFDTAVAALREEGYQLHKVNVPAAGRPGQFTSVKVLARQDVPWKDLVRDPGLIKMVTRKSDDGGRTYTPPFQTPIDISSNRVKIQYAEDGGAKADGLIYVRPGKPELSLGSSNYAQVRISIDGTHYLKGMAVYKDDLPPGTDLVFNTNKTRKEAPNKLDAMKPQKDDPDLPFGSVVDQIKGPDGKVSSAMNIVNEQGKWDDWSKNLPSQFLSKQSPDLAKRQLDKTYDARRKDFDEIASLTNPVVKKRLLESFADETDSAAVHLKAHHLPKQATKVLIPIQSIKEQEVYAPGFEDGTRLALVRFPHGGTFEIPQVTVNNKNREARSILGLDAADAIGIHHKVAERLSGADFDGDTVLAIPNNRGEVRSSPALEGLKDFDPKGAYRAYDGMKTVDGGVYNAKTKEIDYQGRKPNPTNMQRQMGDVSNLITDMTIKGASQDELARAVRHSMVVIDCEKHVLDYKASERDNAIGALKKRYQGKANAGAATLISRAKSPKYVDAFKPRPASEGGPIDKETGRLVFVPKGEPYTNKKGQVVTPKMRVPKLAATQDPYDLVSDRKMPIPIERVYADHSKRMKDLANEARKELVSTETRPMSESAKRVYKDQVASLDAKLNRALTNTPLERQAQAYAASVVAQKKAANPHLEKSDLKKIEAQALAEGRVRTGALKKRIDLEDEEWRAIQAGAISNNKLEQILRHSDLDRVRELATPKTKVLMSTANASRAKAMLARGATLAEVSAALGVSLSTLKDGIKEGG